MVIDVIYFFNQHFLKHAKSCIYVILTKACIYLSIYQEYQKYFHKTKEELKQKPAEPQFDFSEMYIFGKFDAFQRRLNKILAMFSTINTYSALQDSKIEGLETMATRFQVYSLKINAIFNVKYV